MKSDLEIRIYSKLQLKPLEMNNIFIFVGYAHKEIMKILLLDIHTYVQVYCITIIACICTFNSF